MHKLVSEGLLYRYTLGIYSVPYSVSVSLVREESGTGTLEEEQYVVLLTVRLVAECLAAGCTLAAGEREREREREIHLYDRVSYRVSYRG